VLPSAIQWQYFTKLTPTILLGAFSGAIITQYLSFDCLRISAIKPENAPSNNKTAISASD
jgi:hypothetical protein